MPIGATLNEKNKMPDTIKRSKFGTRVPQGPDQVLQQEPDQVWQAESRVSGETQEWDNEKAIQNARDENTVSFLHHSGWIGIVFMYFVALVFIISIAIWFVHFLVPDQWQWLTETQLSKIQTVIFSGSFGAILSAYAQRHLNQHQLP